MKKIYISRLLAALIVTIASFHASAQPQDGPEMKDINPDSSPPISEDAGRFKINLNTADVTELEQGLSGVGPSKAAAIVAYREQNGLFSSLDQLTMVRGIGEKTLEENRHVLTLGLEN